MFYSIHSAVMVQVPVVAKVVHGTIYQNKQIHSYSF